MREHTPMLAPPCAGVLFGNTPNAVAAFPVAALAVEELVMVEVASATASFSGTLAASSGSDFAIVIFL
jgi:hypothetical protein